MSNHQITVQHDGRLTATGKCPMSGKDWELKDIDPIGYQNWRRGMLIQDALPELNADQRELLISGTTPEAWESMWGGEDEDEDEG